MSSAYWCSPSLSSDTLGILINHPFFKVCSLTFIFSLFVYLIEYKNILRFLIKQQYENSRGLVTGLNIARGLSL